MLFDLINDTEGVELSHVNETKYLHEKLAHVEKPFPSFRPSGFRSLEPPTKEEEKHCEDLASPLAETLRQDEELWMLLERLRYLARAISEADVAREIINARIASLLTTTPVTPPQPPRTTTPA